MRRTFIILAFLAFNAHAVDCIRAKFDIFVAQYEALNDNYTGLVIDSTSSEYTQEKYTFSNDHTYLWTWYTRMSPDGEFKKYEHQQMSYKAEISQEGDFKIYDRGPPSIQGIPHGRFHLCREVIKRTLRYDYNNLAHPERHPLRKLLIHSYIRSRIRKQVLPDQGE